jgi:hypothetical protein
MYKFIHVVAGKFSSQRHVDFGELHTATTTWAPTTRPTTNPRYKSLVQPSLPLRMWAVRQTLFCATARKTRARGRVLVHATGKACQTEHCITLSAMYLPRPDAHSS